MRARKLQKSRIIASLTQRWLVVAGWCFVAWGAALHGATHTVDLPQGAVRMDRLLVCFKNKGQDPSLQAAALAKLQSEGYQIASSWGHMQGMACLEMSDAVQRESLQQSTPEVQKRALYFKMKALVGSGLFDYVEPDYMLKASRNAADTAFTDGRLWGLQNTGQGGGLAGADIRAAQAWDITTGSNAIVVGVIDSGINYNHVDLAPNMWRNPREIAGNRLDDDGNGVIDDVFGLNAITGSGDPNDDNGHGSHCAGTIGAAEGNSGTHVGVAWNVKLMGLKFLDASGGGATSDAITCIEYAIAQRVDILSNSWGGGVGSQSLEDAITAAGQANILFVAAAGNDSANIDREPAFPAAYENPNILTVAAINRNDRMAGFSNFGYRSTDLGAPGVDIYSTWMGGPTSYNTISGTSMACPHVSGVAALVKARFPTLTATGLKQALTQTVRRTPAMEGRTLTGGVVDAFNAVRQTADGVLDVTAYPDAVPLEMGVQSTIAITVTDLTPVLSAAVSARFGSVTFTNFLDGGLTPDITANDGIYTATLTGPNDGSIANLEITITAPGKQSFRRVDSFVIVNPPVNDDFARRITIPVNATSIAGMNEFATSEGNEPSPVRNGGVSTVWWAWQAPRSESVVMSTSGSSFDTILAVYTGTALETLTNVTSNDNFNDQTSQVTFEATAGTIYQLQVRGFQDQVGNIVLNVPSQSANPIIIRNPKNQTVVAGDALVLEVGVAGAGPFAIQWFRDDVPLSGQIGARLTIANFSQAEVGTYYVEVANANGTTQSLKVTAAIQFVQPSPGNDAFRSAANLAALSGRLTTNNSDASGESGEPDHADAGAPQHSVWWRWTAPSTPGTFTLDTAGSGFDTVAASYTGTVVNSLNLIAANDNNGTSTRAFLSFRTTPSTTYALVIDGRGMGAGDISADYVFTPDNPAVTIPNDQFTNATTIPPATLTQAFTGQNTTATGELNEPEHGADIRPINSVWWKWTPTSNGELVVDTIGSSFDTLLAAYTGSALANLTALAANDDIIDGSNPQSKISLTITTGRTYYFAVDGYQNETGNIAFNFKFTAVNRPANDNFVRAIPLSAVQRAYFGSNENASAETGEPNHAMGATPSGSVWWSFRAPAAGLLTLDTLDSDFDTILAVYTGSSVNALTLVAENDDALPPFLTASAINTFLQAGVTYYVAVDGSGGVRGNIGFNSVFIRFTLEEAVDAPSLTFTGEPPSARAWNLTANDSIETIYGDSARSGIIPHNAATSFQTMIQGPSNVSFSWKVSSQIGGDLLQVFVDGVQRNVISGEQDWAQVALTLPSGLHTVRWTYQKNASGVAGQDAGWVDALTATNNIANIAYDSSIIDDDSAGQSQGNGNRRVEAGESIELAVSLRNLSVFNAQNVSATLTTTDPFVEEITDGFEDFDDIPSGQVVRSEFDFDFRISPQAPAGRLVAFSLNITDGTNNWTRTFTVPIVSGYQAWLGSYPTLTATEQAPLADPDQDGQSNLLEYFHNTSPTQPSSAASMSITRRLGTNTYRLRFRRNKTTNGLSVNYQWSTDLTNWIDRGVTHEGRTVNFTESILDTTSPVSDAVELNASPTQPLGTLYFRIKLN